MTARRIGLLGGTFDPIHCGHLDLGHAAEASLGLTTMFVMTASTPPHRPQPVASGYHRFAMAAIAVADRAHWRTCDLELLAGGLSYTSTTLKRLHDRGYAPQELFFIVGADAFADIEAWKDYPAILDDAHFAVVSRPGNSVRDLPRRLPGLAPRMVQPPVEAVTGGDLRIVLIDRSTADVSSTAIRQLRAEGRPIAGLVPAGVQQHIEQHGLYTSAPPIGRASDASTDPAAGRLHGQS